MENCKKEFNAFVLKHGVKAVRKAVKAYRVQEGDGSTVDGCQPPSGGCPPNQDWNAILCKCQDDIGGFEPNEK